MSQLPEENASQQSPDPVEPSQSPEGAVDWKASAKRVLRQPPFLVVVVILLAAALGLNAAVSFMQLHFKKEAVPLARPLGAIPAQLGTWVQVSQDKALDSEIQDVLGTDQYIFRDYVDERLVPAVAERFKDKNEEERRAELQRIRARLPSAVVSISVTYYTGMVDTVAHVPDRCVTADGYEPKPDENQTVPWAIGRDLPVAAKRQDSSGQPTDQVEVRYINFEDQTGASNVTRSIAYFFHTNGDFVASPLEVRQKLAYLLERRAYYAKIETMTTMDNSQESARVMTDFLTNALPAINNCLPDWNKLHETGGEKAGGEKLAAK